MYHKLIILVPIIFLAFDCQKVHDVQDTVGEEVTVNYSVAVADATKALNDGADANYVWYALYKKSVDEQGVEKYTLAKEYAQVALTAGEAVCPVTMMREQSYRIVFVAQHYDSVPDGESTILQPIYTHDAEKHLIEMPNAAVANSGIYDAFYTVDEIDNYDGKAAEPVTLKRLTAQVNFLTSTEDWNAASDLSMTPTHSSVKVEGLSQSFDLLTGTPSVEIVEQPVTYERSQIPGNEHIASFFCFASDVIKVTLDLYTSEDGTSNRTIVVDNVPVKSNMKTNIKGRMMTGTLDYQITLDTVSSSQEHPID